LKDITMAIGSWPKAFDAKQMAVTGGTQYVRVGGNGPAVALLHGFGDTGDMWVTCKGVPSSATNSWKILATFSVVAGADKTPESPKARQVGRYGLEIVGEQRHHFIPGAARLRKT
jgi:hypothetical protein